MRARGKKSAAERSATETKHVAVERKGAERSSAEIVCFRASGTDPRHQRYCDDALLNRWREQPVPHELRGERVSESAPFLADVRDGHLAVTPSAVTLRLQKRSDVWVRLFERYAKLDADTAASVDSAELGPYIVVTVALRPPAAGTAGYSGRGTLAPIDRTKRSVNGTFERIFSDPDPKNAVVWLFMTLFHLLPRDLNAFWFGTRYLPKAAPAPPSQTSAPPSTDATHILGPVSLSVHRSAGGVVARFVYLFGDIHVRKPVCEPNRDKHARSAAQIDDWIADAVRGSPDVVDVFLEHDYYGKYRSMHEARLAQADRQTANGDLSFMTDVAAKFPGCWTGGHKRACAWRGKARLHAVDIRAIDEHNGAVIADILRLLTPNDNLDTFRGAVVRLARVVAPPGAADRVLRIPNPGQARKLERQFEHVRDPWIEGGRTLGTLGDLLRRMLKRDLARVDVDLAHVDADPRALADALVRTAAKGEKSVEWSDWRPLVAPALRWFLTVSTLVDYYVAGRLLRSFADGTRVRKAIVFVGEAHADALRDIFRRLGAAGLDLATSFSAQALDPDAVPFQCLDVRGLARPLFGVAPTV